MVIPSRSNRRHRNAAIEQSPMSAALRALEEGYKEVEARKSEAFRRGMLLDSPTLVDHGPLRVLLSATPTPETMDTYIRNLTVNNVTHVVRVCEDFYYPASALTDAGFVVHDWFFPDGDPPPRHIVDKWLSLLDRVVRLSDYANSVTSAFVDNNDNYDSMSDAMTNPSPGSSADLPRSTVAIHCAAGLGRSPALVAVALVELGLAPAEAVGWLRALRRGAINAQQCAFLYNYKTRPLQPKKRHNSDSTNTAVPGGKRCSGGSSGGWGASGGGGGGGEQQSKQACRVRSALSGTALWPPRWGRSMRSRSPSLTRKSTTDSPRGTGVSQKSGTSRTSGVSFSLMRS